MIDDLETLTVDEQALAAGAPLPSAWYTDPSMLALEEVAIFSRAWRYAGPAGAVERPGQFFTTNLRSLPVLIARTEQGELAAMANVCQHRGAIVASGMGTCKAFKCPYHGWTYGLDGRLKAAPWMAEKPDPERFGLPRLQVGQFGPFVFVAPEAAGSFDEFVSSLPDRVAGTGASLTGMRLRTHIDYDIAANWKALVENFAECYHCPTVHPYFPKYVDLDNYEFEFGENWFAQGGPDPRDPAKLGRELDIRCGLFVVMWPCGMLNVYPGADNVSAMLVTPITPSRSTIHIDFYFGPDVTEADADEIVQFTDKQLREDWNIAESVQRGLDSGAFRAGQLNVGVATGRSEDGVNRFHSRVYEALRSHVR